MVEIKVIPISGLKCVSRQENLDDKGRVTYYFTLTGLDGSYVRVQSREDNLKIGDTYQLRFETG